MFGYMLTHYSVLKRGEAALKAGDETTVKALVQKHIPHWCNTILSLAGVTVTVNGRENIPADRTCVFVANHRSYFDIPLLLVSLDQPHGILAKEELHKIPLLNRWMTLLGCVYVQRDDATAAMHSLTAATKIVDSGKSFIIFPEGTRYKGEEGGIGEFKNGAFLIATRAKAMVVPVAITNARAIYEGHNNIMTPTHITITILPPIETSAMGRAEKKQLPEAVQQAIIARLSD
jgi:1-acyl-sn-glycerol-3-phosphate acyltransferase